MAQVPIQIRFLLPAGGSSVVMHGQNPSGSGGLSRVSVAIRNELHAADWKIERSAIILDKRLGKGGFGEKILDPAS